MLQSWVLLWGGSFLCPADICKRRKLLNRVPVDYFKESRLSVMKPLNYKVLPSNALRFLQPNLCDEKNCAMNDNLFVTECGEVSAHVECSYLHTQNTWHLTTGFYTSFLSQR